MEKYYKMTREYVDIWLCAECMFADVNGELPEDEERAQEIEEGFERLGGDISPDFDSEENGYDEFSWEPCDCCGTHLGGSRYRYALWVKS